MTLDEFFDSPDFLVLQDEILRKEAIRAVEKIQSDTPTINRHQIYSIPAVIQGEGYRGLVAMTKKQKEKNSSKSNKAFWGRIDEILANTSVSEISLFQFMKTLLLERDLINPENEGQDKKEQKRIRKRNNQIVEIVIDRILYTYFEHFNCHYFFTSKKGETR